MDVWVYIRELLRLMLKRRFNLKIIKIREAQGYKVKGRLHTLYCTVFYYIHYNIAFYILFECSFRNCLSWKLWLLSIITNGNIQDFPFSYFSFFRLEKNCSISKFRIHTGCTNRERKHCWSWSTMCTVWIRLIKHT